MAAKQPSGLCCFNLYLTEFTGPFDFSPAYSVNLAFQLSGNAEGNRQEQYAVNCTDSAAFLCQEGDPLTFSGKPCFLLTGVTGLWD